MSAKALEKVHMPWVSVILIPKNKIFVFQQEKLDIFMQMVTGPFFETHWYRYILSRNMMLRSMGMTEGMFTDNKYNDMKAEEDIQDVEVPVEMLLWSFHW